MEACHIQYVLFLSLLGFFPCSDTLTCQDGSMVHLGRDLSNTAVEWREHNTVITKGEEMCQEILLLIDVGKKSLILGSKGTSIARHRNVRNITVFARGPGIKAIIFYHVCDVELCNRANSTKVLIDSLPYVAPAVRGRSLCPVCLHFKGSCNLNTNLAFCPRGTRCYTSELTLYGGGLSAVFSISGCLLYPQKLLMKNQSSIGTISIVETRISSKGSSSSSFVLVWNTLLAWMLGLRALLSLSSTEIRPLPNPFPGHS
ncbi:CD177 antigen-like isoform X2 [Mastomys coucha]|uniref:CD177 antigen-like isoform X2 n=1 Tax=Mastomys coucha TaxID=35658 RepID=UPI0012619597|nr:CD177 antigen-like isoform X2 [Mastomys coucha]